MIHKSRKQLSDEIESKRKLIDYYIKQINDLKFKLKELEDYKRGFVDATYYLGGKRGA